MQASQTKFDLNEVEQQRADQFIELRRSEPGSPIGGQYSFKFTVTSIGHIVTITDEASGESQDITDYETF